MNKIDIYIYKKKAYTRLRIHVIMGLVIMILLVILSISCKQQISQKEVTGNHLAVENQFPDSITVGEAFVIYKLPFAYDHSVIYNPTEKKWHLYGIQKPMVTFIHLTADSLTQRGWEKQDPFLYNNMEIWAPHIIHYDDLYYMFYTSIDVPRQIRYAVSQDLYEWIHPSTEPLFAFSNEFTDNMKNKDPMVFRDKDQWIMYYSMLKDDKHWVVGYSTSKDLVNWSEPQICFDEYTEEPSVESPFVVKRGKFYYLFLSARPWPIGGEEIFVSESPYFWNPENKVKRIDPWHAAEVVRDLDGKWYLTRSSGDEQDFRIAPLYWNDGMEE